MPLWRDRAEVWHEILPGVHRRVLARAAEAMLVLYRIEPDRVFPMHTHRHSQFGTVLEGGGTFTVGGRSWTVGPGDAYCIPPEVRHELKTDPRAASVILDVFVPEREDFLPEASAPDEP